MLTCGIWVKRGIAKEVPDKVELHEDDVQRLLEDTKEKIKDIDGNEDLDLDEEKQTILSFGPNKAEEITEETNETIDESIDEVKNEDGDSDDEIRAEYGLDNYDEEGAIMTGAGMSGLMYFNSNEEDPYITMKDTDEEDKEDFIIKKEDNLFVVGKMEEDYSCLDVYVYNEEEDSCYVHHDILLDSFPLCLEWLSFDAALEGKSGNYVAVGSMESDIQIWDLDIIDTVEPAFTLAGYKKKKKKKKKDSETNNKASGHCDAVLSISWNHNVKNVLASGSADHTVVLWDMSQCACVHTLKHHTDKVQSISWHPFESQSLLTGAFDKTANVLDCRSPNEFKSWKLTGECEEVMWDKHSPYNFFVSSDDGIVCYCDVRQDQPVFTINAHNEAVNGMSLSSQYGGCITTVSSDNYLKVWDYRNNTPTCVLSRDMKMGDINFISGCPDIPLTFALGGTKDGVRMLNLLDTTQGAQYHSSLGKASFVPTDSTIVNNNQSKKNDSSQPGVAMETEGAAAADALASLQIDTQKTNKEIIKKKKKKKK